jgi:membrane dipeptidase
MAITWAYGRIWGRPIGAAEREKTRVLYGSVDARAMHDAYPAIDLHADTLMWSRWIGYELGTRHEPFFPASAFFGHVDVPRLRDGGIGAQFFGLVSLPVSGRGNVRAIDEQIDALDAFIASGGSSHLRKVRTAEEIDEVRRAGITGALLGIEGAHALDGDLNRVEHFARRGVRYLGLLHFSHNEAGYPAYGTGRRDTDGLTLWGQELVRRCEEASIVVDLAHINRRGFLDACAMATRPLIVSHTGVTGANEHWRNIDDDQIRAVASKGGVVGIIFCPRFLGGNGLDDVIRHLRHVIDVGGQDLPALGSDWDGMIIPTPDLRDAAHLPLLTDAMMKAGFGETLIAKILRGNAQRVLRDCPVKAPTA